MLSCQTIYSRLCSIVYGSRSQARAAFQPGLFNRETQTCARPRRNSASAAATAVAFVKFAVRNRFAAMASAVAVLLPVYKYVVAGLAGSARSSGNGTCRRAGHMEGSGMAQYPVFVCDLTLSEVSSLTCHAAKQCLHMPLLCYQIMMRQLIGANTIGCLQAPDPSTVRRNCLCRMSYSHQNRCPGSMAPQALHLGTLRGCPHHSISNTRSRTAGPHAEAACQSLERGVEPQMSQKTYMYVHFDCWSQVNCQAVAAEVGSSNTAPVHENRLLCHVCCMGMHVARTRVLGESNALLTTCWMMYSSRMNLQQRNLSHS